MVAAGDAVRVLRGGGGGGGYGRLRPRLCGADANGANNEVH